MLLNPEIINNKISIIVKIIAKNITTSIILKRRERLINLINFKL
jgi:hypothetical protein